MWLPGILGARLRNIALKLICLKIGKGCIVYEGTKAIHCYNISLGNNVNINSGVYIDGHDRVVIGDSCLIGPGVKILTSNHEIDNIDRPMSECGLICLPVTIEEDVWLGSNVIITPGVRLSKGTVVAAGAVVTKDTEPYTIYAGIPAKILRRRKL